MRHFKRNLKKPNGSLNTTKVWKQFIKKELQTNNLFHLLHLSEEMRFTLLNLKVEHAHFFRGEESKESTCSIAFRDFQTDEIFEMTLFLESQFINFYQDFPGHECIDDSEYAVAFDIFKKAPLAMLCYYESFYFQKSFNQFSNNNAATTIQEGALL